MEVRFLTRETTEDPGRVSLLLSSNSVLALVPPLALQIDLIHDTHHLGSPLRTDRIKAMSRLFFFFFFWGGGGGAQKS